MTSILHTLLFSVVSMNEVMRQVRGSVLSVSNVLVPTASALAAIFVAISLVRLSYEILDDKGGGGAVGLKASEILIPIMLLVCINAYRPIIQVVDSVIDSIAGYISDDEVLDKAREDSALVYYLNCKCQKGAGGKLAVMLDTLNSNIQNQKLNTIQHSIDFSHSYVDDLDSRGKLAGMSAEDRDGLLYKLQVAAADYASSMIVGYALKKNIDINDTDDVVAEAKAGLWASAFELIYNWLYPIVLALANIILCVMAIYGPLCLAFAVLKPWRKAPIDFFAKYITVSMWKAVAAIIVWVCSIAKSAVSYPCIHNFAKVLNDIEKSDVISPDIVSRAEAVKSCNFLVTLAGVIALLAVSELTETVLNIAHTSLSSTVRNAGKVAGKAIKIVGGTAKLAGKAVLHIT